MNSDVMHSRVPNGPTAHRPKDNNGTAGAEERNFQSAPKRTLLDELILKNLVTEVKETVATDVVFSKPRNRSFGAVNLWNMRRRSRYAGHPRKNPTIITGFGF